MALTFKGIKQKFKTNPRGNENYVEIFTEYTFNHRIKRATTTLNGFRLRFLNGDHKVETLQVDIQTQVDNFELGTVTARIRIMLADKNADDGFEGFVDVVVFVEY